MSKDSTGTAKKRRKPRSQGTPKQVKQALFLSIRELERVITQPSDTTELIKASHALATCAGAWSKLYEQFDLEQRMADLEAEIEDLKQ
jgi:hypothetical protein